MIFQIFNSYLTAGKKFHVVPKIQLNSCGTYWIFAYILVYKLDLGVLGAAWTVNIQQTVSGVLTIWYCYHYNPIPKTFFFLEKDSFKGLWDLFKYGCECGSMIFFQQDMTP